MNASGHCVCPYDDRLRAVIISLALNLRGPARPREATLKETGLICARRGAFSRAVTPPGTTQPFRGPA